jgi:hypothetical protein
VCPGQLVDRRRGPARLQVSESALRGLLSGGVRRSGEAAGERVCPAWPVVRKGAVGTPVCGGPVGCDVVPHIAGDSVVLAPCCGAPSTGLPRGV